MSCRRRATSPSSARASGERSACPGDLAGLPEVGDNGGVQAVSLGQLPLGPGEVTDLAGVDDGDREAGRPECGGDGRLIAPRWLP